MDPVQKEVIAPPAPSSSPLHRHTGFVIAIVITSVLLIIAAVLAYLSWDNGLKLARENISLLNAAGELQAQNNDLQDQLAAKAGPIPFYYFVSKDPLSWFSEPSELHALNPITNEDIIIFTTPDAAMYRVVAQPRRGWDGHIVINKLLKGDNPGYTLYTFDVSEGTELVPAAVQSKLPVSADATSLSSDERYLAAIYDVGQIAPREFAFLDLLTGAKYTAATLPPDQYFAKEYMEFGESGEIAFMWLNHDCVRTFTYHQVETERRLSDSPTYCISDFVQNE